MCGWGAAAVGLSAAGRVMDARQQRNIGRANAAIARQDAERSREIGRFNEARARDRMDRIIAAQRTQLISRGVSLDSPSALRAGADAAAERFVEAQAQRFNASSRTTSLENEATIRDARAQSAFANGVFLAGTRALTGSLQLWPGLAERVPT